MQEDQTTGFFGKLPAHGDFLYRNLPVKFVNVWDEWLQGFVHSTQEQLSEDWLDVYLTSPIWRFVFSTGAVDKHEWAGVVLPSVDRVGRYFPFSVLARLPAGTNPMQFAALQSTWFEKIEQSCLSALEGKIRIDALIQEINDHAIDDVDQYVQVNSATLVDNVHTDFALEEQSPAVVMPVMLDSFCQKLWSSYSFWWTKGSDRVYPCSFASQALPKLKGVAAMLDGNWDNWQWDTPTRLKLESKSL